MIPSMKIKKGIQQKCSEKNETSITESERINEYCFYAVSAMLSLESDCTAAPPRGCVFVIFGNFNVFERLSSS